MLREDEAMVGVLPRPSHHEASTPTFTAPADRSTISAVEMARLCGVGRERLRTWERRHGFPRPARAENGVRRYYPEDVRRVVAVARMVAAGVMLGEAIERVLAAAEPDDGVVAFDAFDASLRDAVMPVIALTGPEPLIVAWTNSATAKLPDGPCPGDRLAEVVPEFGAAASSQVQRLLAGVGPDSVVIEHADWQGTFPVQRRSLAWRVAPEASAQPVVVLAQLPHGVDQRGAQPDEAADGEVWGRAVTDASNVLRRDAGLASVQRALGEFVRDTGAIDGFFALSRGEWLRAASSVRGLFPAGPLAFGTSDARLAPVYDGRVDWLPGEVAKELGAMPCSALMVVPMTASGVLVGAVFVAYPRELPLGDAARAHLSAFGLVLALTVQREQVRAPARTR